MLNAKYLSQGGIPGRPEAKLLLLKGNIGWASGSLMSEFGVGSAFPGYVIFFGVIYGNLPYGVTRVRYGKVQYPVIRTLPKALKEFEPYYSPK